MRIVLITPSARSYIWRKKKVAFTLPPMALPLLAAFAPAGIEVRLIEEAIEDIDLNIEADLIGLSVVAASSLRAYELIELFLFVTLDKNTALASREFSETPTKNYLL
jgi:hypothetical protein